MHLKEINKEKTEIAYANDTETEQPNSHILIKQEMEILI